MSPRCKRSAVAHADMVVVISRGCEARIWLTLNRFGARPAIGDHLPGSRNLRGRVWGESLVAVATVSPQKCGTSHGRSSRTTWAGVGDSR